MTPPLNELYAFACVARHRGLAAAQELGVSASALHHSLRQLEARLQVRLLHHTTRSVTATEAGEALLARLVPALGRIDSALEAVNDFAPPPATRPAAAERAAHSGLPAADAAAAGLVPALPGIRLDLMDRHVVDMRERRFRCRHALWRNAGRRHGSGAVGPPMRFAVIASQGSRAQRRHTAAPGSAGAACGHSPALRQRAAVARGNWPKTARR